jgi:branched-chain amino acid transport system substrate-binding protein
MATQKTKRRGVMKKKKFSVFLSVLCVAAAFLSMSFVVSAQAASKDPIKFGLLCSYTGILAHYGKIVQTGLELGFEEVGWQVAGREIKLLTEDDGTFDAVKGLEKAKKLAEVDKVDIVFGPCTSGVYVATAPYFEERKRLNIHFGWRGELRIWEKPRYDATGGGSLGQWAYPAGLWAAKEKGFKKAVTVGTDYETGYQGAGAFSEGFRKAGGTIVQQHWPSPGTNDWGPYFSRWKDADCTAIIAFGPDMLSFIKQFYEFGLWKKQQLILLSNDSVQERDLAQFGDWVQGLVSATDYVWTIDNEVNNKFVKAYEAKAGHKPPPSAGAMGYQSALIFLSLMEATGGDTNQKVMRDALMNLRVEVPSGTFEFTDKGYPIRDCFIAEAKKKNGEFVWEVIHTTNNASHPGYYTKP